MILQMDKNCLKISNLHFTSNATKLKRVQCLHGYIFQMNYYEEKDFSIVVNLLYTITNAVLTKINNFFIYRK